MKKKRDLVIVSGYYGFDNLGDEAILEELIDELTRLVPQDQIVVLSNNPRKTAATFGVRAVNRWRLSELLAVLPAAKLFISGGGGLFQDKSSFRTPIFYAVQILLARICGAKVMIYAQGIGPLNNPLSAAFSRMALALAQTVTVRDRASLKMLSSWGIKATLTADPVWCLQAKELPASVWRQLEQPPGKEKDIKIGLSLRPFHNFTDEHRRRLLKAMRAYLPSSAVVILIPMQAKDDHKVLIQFQEEWTLCGGKSIGLDLHEMTKPSQWLSLMQGLDMLIGMRLHAVIMALKLGVPVAGLAYDPKVLQVLQEFEQPILNLHKEESADDWSESIRMLVERRLHLLQIASQKAGSAKSMACQNFDALARILAD